MAAEFSGKHGTAGQTNRRQIAGSGTHQQRGGGLVAAHEQNDSVDGVAANRLFHIHAGEVAEQHSGGTQLRLPQRHNGKLERKTAGLPHTAFHKLGELAKVTVAGRELRPCVADSDDRTPIEQVVRPALILPPTPVEESIAIFSPVPCLAAQLLHCAVLTPRSGLHWRSLPADDTAKSAGKCDLCPLP